MMGLFKRFGFAAVVVAGLALMLVVVVGKATTDAVFGGDGAVVGCRPLCQRCRDPGGPA